jgi:hypothetical protein
LISEIRSDQGHIGADPSSITRGPTTTAKAMITTMATGDPTLIAVSATDHAMATGIHP